jgi:hypothetical protein
MDPVEGQAEGVLVVRVWRDDDNRFRARLTIGTGGDLEGRSVVATTHEQVLRLVRAWLLTFPQEAGGAGTSNRTG